MTSIPRWYGLPAAIAFGASDTFMIVGLVAGDGKLAGAAMELALITHGLAGPINHWAHGHVGRGFASLGLNAGIPAFMLIPGVFFTLASKSETPLIVAPLLGELVFNAIDVAVLSNDEEKLPWIPPKGARALLPSSVAVVPMLDPKRLGVALVGQF